MLQQADPLAELLRKCRRYPIMEHILDTTVVYLAEVSDTVLAFAHTYV